MTMACRRCKTVRSIVGARPPVYSLNGVGAWVAEEPRECMRQLDVVDRTQPSNWIDQPVVLFDTETTGTEASCNRIIEIGLVAGKFSFAPSGAGEFVVEDTYCTLLQPDRELPKIITEITGIRDSDLESAPRFKDVVDSITSFIGGANILGAFNAPFDQAFLLTEYARLGLYPPEPLQGSHKRFAILDPLVWGRWKAKGYGKRANKLGAMAQRLGIERPDALHRADVDALLAGHVFAKMMPYVPRVLADALDLQCILRSEQDIELRTYFMRKREETRGEGSAS